MADSRHLDHSAAGLVRPSKVRYCEAPAAWDSSASISFSAASQSCSSNPGTNPRRSERKYADSAIIARRVSPDTCAGFARRRGGEVVVLVVVAASGAGAGLATTGLAGFAGVGVGVAVTGVVVRRESLLRRMAIHILLMLATRHIR